MLGRIIFQCKFRWDGELTYLKNIPPEHDFLAVTYSIFLFETSKKACLKCHAHFVMHCFAFSDPLLLINSKQPIRIPHVETY